jgi:hypothetical protein
MREGRREEGVSEGERVERGKKGKTMSERARVREIKKEGQRQRDRVREKRLTDIQTQLPFSLTHTFSSEWLWNEKGE